MYRVLRDFSHFARGVRGQTVDDPRGTEKAFTLHCAMAHSQLTLEFSEVKTLQKAIAF